MKCSVWRFMTCWALSCKIDQQKMLRSFSFLLLLINDAGQTYPWRTMLMMLKQLWNNPKHCLTVAASWEPHENGSLNWTKAMLLAPCQHLGIYSIQNDTTWVPNAIKRYKKMHIWNHSCKSAGWSWPCWPAPCIDQQSWVLSLHESTMCAFETPGQDWIMEKLENHENKYVMYHNGTKRNAENNKHWLRYILYTTFISKVSRCEDLQNSIPSFQASRLELALPGK